MSNNDPWGRPQEPGPRWQGQPGRGQPGQGQPTPAWQPDPGWQPQQPWQGGQPGPQQPWHPQQPQQGGQYGPQPGYGPPGRPPTAGPPGRPPTGRPPSGPRKPLLIGLYALIGVLAVVLGVVGVLVYTKRSAPVAEPSPAVTTSQAPTPAVPTQEPTGPNDPTGSTGPTPDPSATPVPGTLGAVLAKRNFSCAEILPTPTVINCFKSGARYASLNWQAEGETPIALELWGWQKYPTDSDSMFGLLQEAGIWDAKDVGTAKKALRAKLPQTFQTSWGEVTIAENGDYFYTTATKTDSFPERVDQAAFGGGVRAATDVAKKGGLSCKEAGGTTTCSKGTTTIWLVDANSTFSEVKGQWRDDSGRQVYLDVLSAAAEGDRETLMPPVRTATTSEQITFSTAAGFAYTCYPLGSNTFCSVWSPGWWVGN